MIKNVGGAIRETGGAKDETDGADQRKYSLNRGDSNIRHYSQITFNPASISTIH